MVKSSERSEPWEDRVKLATLKWAEALQAEGVHPEFVSTLLELFGQHRTKCRGYGLKNLYKFGPSLQIMRIIDKCSRLEQFMKDRSVEVNPEEELKDIAIMSVLALCLIRDGMPIGKLEMPKSEKCPACKRPYAVEGPKFIEELEKSRTCGYCGYFKKEKGQEDLGRCNNKKSRIYKRKFRKKHPACEFFDHAPY